MKFIYKAATFDGKLQSGPIEAEDEKGAANLLQDRGLVPLEIVPAAAESGASISRDLPIRPGKSFFSRSSYPDWSLPLRKKIRSNDLIMFADHLSTMLSSGVNLNRSLMILSDLSENRHFSRVIQDIQNKIRQGSFLWQALKAYPDVFPPVFINMVRAGEAGGILDVVLNRLSQYMTGIQQLKEYLVSSMIYPVILGLTAFASILVMLLIVVPRFAEIFTDMGVDLPLATQMMLVCGHFLQNYWWLIVLVPAAGFFLFKYLVSKQGGRQRWDRFKLGLPLLGPILLKIEIARFTKTLGALLNSGISILSALNIVKEILTNQILRDSLDLVYNDLKQGWMLSASLEKNQVFPQLAVNMLGVGEESGRMPEMLEKLGDMYDKDLKTAIKSFTSLFEPMVILVMGLVIGAMVVSMLLAIFSLNELGI